MIQIDMPMPEKCSDCIFCDENCSCVASDYNGIGITVGCAYRTGRRDIRCPLKEQEAKPPAIMQDIEGIWSTCSMCGHKLRPILAMKMDTYFPKFCSECGQEVKWK